MDYKIKNVHADYNHAYNPETANNGGGYWQFWGDCQIVTSTGAVINVEFNNSSCGDFGHRYNMKLMYDNDEFNIWEDNVSDYSDDEIVWRCMQNKRELDKFKRLTGIDPRIVNEVASAIECAAFDSKKN